MNSSALILDIETARGILKRGEQPELNPVTGAPYLYASGFDDHDNPPAVTGIFDCQEGNKPVRFFFQEQLAELAKLIEQRRYVVTFNGDTFDLPKLARVGVEVPAWKSVDLAALLSQETGTFCSLDALAEINLGVRKNGNGAEAPKLWQRFCAKPDERLNDLWQLLDYCNTDCWVTWRLFMRALKSGSLKHPKTGALVRVRLPEMM